MPDLNKLILFEDGALSEEATLALFQDGIDKGWVWGLQGFYGRTAQRLIHSGLCHSKGE